MTQVLYYYTATVMSKHEWLSRIHSDVLTLMPNDCKICSLKWIKHDGSLGTSVQPINVEGKYIVSEANHTPPHRDYMS